MGFTEPRSANQIGLQQAARVWASYWDLLLAVVGVKAVAETRSCLSSHLVQVLLRPGTASSAETRDLNPRFAEMLMGWPDGWTDWRSPVTAFCPWLRRSRTYVSELLSGCHQQGSEGGL